MKFWEFNSENGISGTDFQLVLPPRNFESAQFVYVRTNLSETEYSSIINNDDRNNKRLTRYSILFYAKIYGVTNEVKDLQSNKTE